MFDSLAIDTAITSADPQSIPIYSILSAACWSRQELGRSRQLFHKYKQEEMTSTQSMGDTSAAAHACQCCRLLNEVCAYVDLGLDSLHAKAERRRGLPWGAGQGNGCSNRAHALSSHI